MVRRENQSSLTELRDEAQNEWNEWEERKEGLEEKRNRLRVTLKQRFEEWAVRPTARSLVGALQP